MCGFSCLVSKSDVVLDSVHCTSTLLIRQSVTEPVSLPQGHQLSLFHGSQDQVLVNCIKKNLPERSGSVSKFCVLSVPAKTGRQSSWSLQKDTNAHLPAHVCQQSTKIRVPSP